MKADRITSIVFIVTGLVFWSQTGDLQQNCSVFPRLLILFLIFLSAIMFGQTFFITYREKAVVAPDVLKYILISIVVVALWISLVDILGFIVSSVLCLTMLTLMLDLDRPTPIRFLSTLAVYALMVVSFWLIFHKLLLVPLPEGYLI